MVCQIAEVKRLQSQIAGVHSELARSEEELGEARRLQAFLEELTPKEWRLGLVHQRDERHAAKMQRWQAECDSIRGGLEA